MNEPKVEQNHRPEPRQNSISSLEAQFTKGEVGARALLVLLEKAMVRCGYRRNGVYNSRYVKWAPPGGKPTVLIWRHGKILFGRGVKKDHNGKAKQPYESIPPLGVERMMAPELIRVAEHLPPFLDSLEDHVRHQVKALQKVVETIQEFLDRVEDDPQPSKTPAQMPLE